MNAEILVVDGGSQDGTVEEATAAGGRVIPQQGRGYGGALRTGFAAARGRHVQTMDSDLSHEPEVIVSLWEARDRADIVIASRYVPGGGGEMPVLRAVLSRILNVVFTKAFRLGIHDISSGFRLYRRSALQSITFHASDFDVLEEILILIANQGGTLTEVPFQYRPAAGRTIARQAVQVRRGVLPHVLQDVETAGEPGIAGSHARPPRFIDTRSFASRRRRRRCL